ncbi:MAG: Mrp/NBP35 family ATP-binding protein [Bacteroidia bacterium]|nr:Mrp/NBP35 family ATP-binding protein [Bacteroidia bacterium]MDW8416323.1 P-loop NTPase [Bacteroidia bacterium]
MESSLQNRIYDALREVIDPDLRQNIVDAGMVKGLAWNEKDRKVSLTVELTTPACPLKGYFAAQISQVIKQSLGSEWEAHTTFSAQSGRITRETLSQIRHLLLVGSGKGGVGKSTVAVNLAIALAKLGARVGILDADIYGPSVPMLLGLEHAKPAVREKEGRPYLVPIQKYGLEIMSLGFLVPHGQATPWRGPMASNTLRQLLTETDWGELDYLVVDMPPGTGDIQITLAQQFRPQGAIIVTTPQKLAQADAEKALTMFRMPLVQVPVVGIVENMSYFWTPELPERKFYIFGESGGRMLADKYEVPFLGEIPLLEKIVHQSDAGVPACLEDGTPISQSFMEIAGETVRALARLELVSAP